MTTDNNPDSCAKLSDNTKRPKTAAKANTFIR